MKQTTKTFAILIGFLFAQICTAEVSSAYYSELLKDAVNNSRTAAGFNPLNRDRFGLAMFVPLVKDLNNKESVPFLINVIKNGPEWKEE